MFEKILQVETFSICSSARFLANSFIRMTNILEFQARHQWREEQYRLIAMNGFWHREDMMT